MTFTLQFVEQSIQMTFYMIPQNNESIQRDIFITNVSGVIIISYESLKAVCRLFVLSSIDD